MTDERSRPADGAGRSWLETCLRHPTLPVAVIGVLSTVAAATLPPLRDMIEARALDIPVSAAQHSRDVQRFFSKPGNERCPSTEFEPMRLSDNTELSAILCASGDVVVMVKRTSRSGAPEQFLYPVLYESVIAKIDAIASTPAPERVAGAGLLSAHAAGRDVLGADRVDHLFAQSGATVVWTRQVDGRTLLRRLRAGDQCFDELIDTATGRVISTTPVPC